MARSDWILPRADAACGKVFHPDRQSVEGYRSTSHSLASRLVQMILALYLIPALLIVFLVGALGIMIVGVVRLFCGEGDDQGQHDPVVSPTDQGLGATGDERVVMHAGTVEGQPAFATEGVVDGPEEGGARGENRDDQLGQAHGEGVDVPGGVAEEAMKPRPVSVSDEDDFSHVGDRGGNMGHH